jgi:dihydroxy-acid dehydratase
VIRPRENPVYAAGGLAVLKGNLAPSGAIIKRSAASEHLLRHQGRAVVFEGLADLYARIDDPALPVDETSVLVLRNTGPVGGPGMPEWGMLPIPKKLLERGVRDMVRLSDARMSGTHYGTVVLHIAPEAAVGGPLSLVRDGDPILLDVEARRLDLLVADADLEERRRHLPPRVQTIRGAGRASSPTTCVRPIRARISMSSKAWTKRLNRRSIERMGMILATAPWEFSP